MPRAPTIKQSESASRSSGVADHVLKRNQACHQCRKKKLKCDAQAPCSACIKTHAYAVKTHPLTASTAPECTYDDPDQVSVAPKTKIQRLEAKIAHLESMMTTQSTTPPSATETQTPIHLSPNNGSQTLTNPSPNGSGSSSARSPDAPTLNFGQYVSPILQGLADANRSPDLLYGNPSPSPSVGSTHTSPPQAYFPHPAAFLQPASPPGPLPSILNPIPTSPPTTNIPNQMTDPTWPESLPSLPLLMHLCDAFFNSVPNANRLLHRPTFMNSLFYPPFSREFPHLALLHAICAIGSLYTNVVVNEEDTSEFREQTLKGAASQFHSGIVNRENICHEEEGLPHVIEELLSSQRLSFGRTHAKWAEQMFFQFVPNGRKLDHCVSAMLILTWYYYSLGRSVDVWIHLGQVMRVLIPLGFNAGKGFHPISRLSAPMLYLVDDKLKMVNEEYNRNVFWLAFYTEIQLTAGTVWPLYLHEEDVTQFMPLPLAMIHSEVPVPLAARQRLATPKMLVTHTPGLTDSFTILIKASALLGKVKTFNGRYRSKYDDPDLITKDPRDSAEFQMLDSLIVKFQASIPKEFKDAISDSGEVDPTLLLAHTSAHVAMILLHDPHASMSKNCWSSERIANAISGVMLLIYRLVTTSYDLVFLDHCITFHWFVVGAGLIRFLKTSISEGNTEEANRLEAEINIVKLLLSNMGNRTLGGQRQAQLLEDTYTQEINWANLNLFEQASKITEVSPNGLSR